MGRFEDVDSGVMDLLHETMQEFFPELRNVRIKCLYDTKKRMAGGKIVLGRIQKTNDLLRHLTVEESRSDDGYDCIMYLDRLAWTSIGRPDRVRLMRHELRHIDLSETGSIKIIDHTITDFYEEVSLNEDDPRWRERVATLTADIYEQEKEQAEESPRRPRANRRR